MNVIISISLLFTLLPRNASAIPSTFDDVILRTKKEEKHSSKMAKHLSSSDQMSPFCPMGCHCTRSLPPSTLPSIWEFSQPQKSTEHNQLISMAADCSGQELKSLPLTLSDVDGGDIYAIVEL